MLAAGEERAALVEISAARYNRRTRTATYAVRPLDPEHPAGKSVSGTKERLREWMPRCAAGGGC